MLDEIIADLEECVARLDREGFSIPAVHIVDAIQILRKEIIGRGPNFKQMPDGPDVKAVRPRA